MNRPYDIPIKIAQTKADDQWSPLQCCDDVCINFVVGDGASTSHEKRYHLCIQKTIGRNASPANTNPGIKKSHPYERLFIFYQNVCL